MTTVDAAASRDYSELIAALDLRSKVRALTGASGFTLEPQESIGLGEVRLSDGPTGVRGLRFAEGRPVTLFPNATLLGSAWNEDAMYEVGRLLAEEAMSQQIHVVLGPTINLHRSLLNGRVFEAYSEDPLLTGKLAAAYVQGLQDSRVGACLKHLVTNESETERMSMNSVVDEATLRELYLLPFEIAVEEADPWSIMAAYNRVNGVPATEQQHVINEIVKGEWGYTGLVMSDWYATKSAGSAANAGLDLVMPGPIGPWGAALVGAVESGEVDEAVVDEHVRRLLRLADRVGALGEPREWPADLPAPDSPTRKEQMRRLAAAGMTVLTNRNAVLPLARGQTVALIGRHAVETIDMGGGSAQVPAPYEASVAEGLTALLGHAVTVVDGVEVRKRPIARPTFVTDPVTEEQGMHAWLYGANGQVIEERHHADAATLIVLENVFPHKVTRIDLQARIDATGPVELGVFGGGDWVVRAGSQSLSFSPRSSGSGFAEEIFAPAAESTVVDLRGPTVIDATVATQFPLGITTAEVADAHHAGGVSLTAMGGYGLIARPAPRSPDDVFREAAAAAGAADVAVVVVGVTEEQETESVDKTTLHLPGAQDAMVSAVAAAARKTVVVVNAATPVIMPWRDEVDAILWAGLPGQEGGHAVAAALLGDFEPAGRLVTTFPIEDAQTPAWSVTPVDGNLEYSEGLFIGYRGHYAQRVPAPAFWFGHGLGFSEWQYSEPKVTSGSEAPTLSVTVTNVGDRDSREVVQVYLVPDEQDQPVRLVGWHALTAGPGESVDVQVRTDERMWRQWNTKENAWTQLARGGRLLVARGLGDVRGVVPLV